MENHNNNGDSNSGFCHRRHRRRRSSNIRVKNSVASASASAGTTIATEGEKEMMPVEVDSAGIDIGVVGVGRGVGDREISEADEDAMDRVLPLPGSAMEAGGTTNISVMTGRVAELGRAYDLAHSGIKPKVNLLVRPDRKRRKSLIPAAQRHHKGPRPVTLSKKQPMQNQSMQHRELLFATTPSMGSGSRPQSTYHLQQLPTEHSRDNRTPEEKEAVLEWAHRIAAEYPLDQDPEEDRNRVEGTMPATAAVSVDLAIQKLGGIAEFERIAHALGWTPPASTCSPVLSPPMCDSTQSRVDMPTETDCPAADSDLADLQPGTSALSTNDTPSMAADHQAEGNDRAV